MLDKAKNFLVENKKTAMVVVGVILVGVGAFGIKKKFFSKSAKEAPKEETKKEAPKDNEGFENPK